MSGGSMNYFYQEINSHANELEDRELVELAMDLAEIFRAREWYDSGDTGIGTWTKAVIDFKAKWFGSNSTQRREEMINKACDDLKAELLAVIGKQNFCKDCKHFDYDGSKGSDYGNCPYHKGCMMHQYENCDKFEEKV